MTPTLKCSHYPGDVTNAFGGDNLARAGLAPDELEARIISLIR
jgi:hypothetical protein